MKPPAVVIVAAALLCLRIIANGRELANAPLDAKDELAGELAQCAAYHVIAAAMISARDAIGPEFRDKGVAQEKQISEAARGIGAQLSSAEVPAARMELARQMMQREMKYDWGNFSLIQVKYLLSCKGILEHMAQRFAYWVKEKSKLPDVPPAKPK